MITTKRVYLTLILILFPLISLFSQVLDLTAEGAILMDQHSGRVLYEKSADLILPPASMTKLVSLYLGCQAIERGDLTLDSFVQVSDGGSAFSRPEGSSLMRLEEGQVLTVRDLMLGVAVASGNDGAYQLAELISGDPVLFVQEMNNLVQTMGFDKMHFVDPDGYSEKNKITPFQYAQFCREYISRFPWALKEFHSQLFFSYPKPENMAANGVIKTTRRKKNTNLLLGRVEGVDGLKTGYIDESGFNFSATAQRVGTRFIAVVMGIYTDDYMEGLKQRALEAETLLEYGFDQWKTRELPPLSASILVYKGDRKESVLVPRVLPLYTLSDEEFNDVRVEYTLPDWIVAPLTPEDEVGNVSWYLGDEPIGSSTLVPESVIEKGPFYRNFIDFFRILFYNLTHKEG